MVSPKISRVAGAVCMGLAMVCLAVLGLQMLGLYTRPVFGATLWWVLGVLVVVTVAAVEFGPLARMLQLAAFPQWAWLVVVGLALVSTSCTEPFKRRRAGRRMGRPPAQR